LKIESLIKQLEENDFRVNIEKCHRGNVYTVSIFKRVPYKIHFLKNVFHWKQVLLKVYNIPEDTNSMEKDLECLLPK